MYVLIYESKSDILFQFVHLEGESDESIMQHILMKKWSLNRPTLIISIYGGSFEKNRQLRMIFKKGLWKAAESAGNYLSFLLDNLWTSVDCFVLVASCHSHAYHNLFSFTFFQRSELLKFFV